MNVGNGLSCPRIGICNGSFEHVIEELVSIKGEFHTQLNKFNLFKRHITLWIYLIASVLT